MGLKPNNRNICLLKIPDKIMTIPTINQKGNIVLSPFMLVHCRPTVCVTVPEGVLPGRDTRAGAGVDNA